MRVGAGMPVKIDTVEERCASHEEIAQQVDRILRSETFRSSGILRHLLEYLSACSLEGRSEALKVREIARAVFGRHENFDSQSDSVVRVHTGRLRSKLAEYYIGEGAEDDLIVAIPKGGYGLSWHFRTAGPSQPSLPAPVTVPRPAPTEMVRAAAFEPTPPRSWPKFFVWSILLVALSSTITWLVNQWTSSGRGSGMDQKRPAMTTLWKPFLSKGEPPLVVFSNFRLVGSLDTSVRPYNKAIDKDTPGIIDTYTTIGEVMGVFDVSRTLASFGQMARAKHGQLLTWDEAKDCDLIFVGGPLASTPLRTLSALQELQFKKGIAGLPPETAAIANLHPRPGEQPMYFGPVTRPFTYDYAIIALRPVFNRDRRTLILAGITEYGTQGAAEFVTREDRVSELLGRLHAKPGDSLPPFEALLRVKIEGDVPVQSELLFVHPAK
jgi:hypothetical protein